MDKSKRKTSSLGRAGAAAFLLLLTAGTALAISANGRPGLDQRRQAMRMSQLRAMDVFAQDYGGVDWSIVGAELTSHPEDPANPRIMSIFLSLGNVYLTRFEERGGAADLDRALGLFEAVTGSDDLWGERPLSGSVVAYLAIGLARLERECDVGPFQSRIEDLRRQVIEIAGKEADAIPVGQVYADFFVMNPEEDAARAGLYAAAAYLRPDDPRAPVWVQYARIIAARLSFLGPATEETALDLSQAALLYAVSGERISETPENPVPALIEAFRGSSSGAGPQGSEPAPVFGTGPLFQQKNALETAVRESRKVAALLIRYLSTFPPGSQCESQGE